MTGDTGANLLQVGYGLVKGCIAVGSNDGHGSKRQPRSARYVIASRNSGTSAGTRPETIRPSTTAE